VLLKRRGGAHHQLDAGHGGLSTSSRYASVSLKIDLGGFHNYLYDFSLNVVITS
jgi:hypothetical protein